MSLIRPIFLYGFRLQTQKKKSKRKAHKEIIEMLAKMRNSINDQQSGDNYLEMPAANKSIIHLP